MSVIALGMPGPFEWVFIFLIVIVLFGARRIPEIFEAMGKGVKTFRDAQREEPPSKDEPPTP
ncbi:MAG: twin-arginine translocase TatA/TatE family subunit [Deltaproteobacteria bacterium]|nr:twin-arginine translocase TatA/TatE family subunit [Deltaproteobacteria bacterium]